MDRRTLLKSAASTVLATQCRSGFGEEAPRAVRRILLRSSWQTVNIGDIAHTPGVLHLLEQYLPDVEVRLWPTSVGNGVEAMLMARFPKLKIVQSKEELQKAFSECQFLLHGSGPSLVAAKDVARWATETGKPYGIYGITVSEIPPITLGLLSNAKFAYFRDSVSLEHAKESKVACPIMEFVPDGAFAVDLRNDAAGDAYLKSSGLEAGKFLCCIPRLRNTPYWKIKNSPFDEKKHALNEKMKEHDHAPLRQAIVEVIRQTNHKILLCPEDQTQMEVGKEMLFDKLPDDIKPRVIWREKYWLTDEALSVYVKSAGLFGNEMHSPIMCIGNHIPAIVCRWKEQTSKGFMWKDIGLDDWLFDFDQEGDLPKAALAVVAMAKDFRAARAKVEQALEIVHDRQKTSMQRLGKLLDA